MLVLLPATSTALVTFPQLLNRKARATAKPAPIHIKVSGKWVDVTSWADKHPGGRYVLEWADGYDVTNAFHTIHLFSSAKASDLLARLPEADLTTRETPEAVWPPIERVPMQEQQPTTMDSFMAAGERAVQLVSPPASELPASVPVEPASGLAWQQHDGAMATVGESPLKQDLEAMLKRRFASAAEYKATPEHWARIAGALMLWAGCMAGWAAGSLPATLLLPFAQWLLFSPTVHESSHSTLSTTPWVNKAMAFCGLPFIYNPYIWWPQHILSHHQYTNDDALDVDLHHLRPARLHQGCEVDDDYSGANFIFKGYFSTMGMSILWPVRVLQRKTTGQWYGNLVTPKPDAVSDAELMASLLPVAFVLVWPWLRVLNGDIGALEGFFDWYYPWAVTGAIWTVMTQVSHVQEECQRPPTGDADDYFRWQIESALDYSVRSELVPKLTASLSLQSMHHVLPSVCGCHFHALRPEFEEICARHGVRLNVKRDASAAWRGCIARVFALSSPQLTPAWALDSYLDEEVPATATAAAAAATGTESAAAVAPGDSDSRSEGGDGDGAVAVGRISGGVAALREHMPLIAYFATPGVAMLACSPFF